MRRVLRTLFNTEGCELCRSILVCGLLCGILLVALIVIGIASSSSSLAEREESLPAPDGLLSDVVGEDVLHKLQATQAALQREVEFLKGGPLFDGKVSDATSLARALAHVQADQERLAAEAGHLRSTTDRLLQRLVAQGAGLEIVERQVQELLEAEGD